ncbi:MAG: ribonuclease H-like domain-containing protein [Eubacteriales bacterium]|nr:ribonuclease H-like domain-containing protein [Lachnospiraceae bacterium]MDO5127767.1 ribonuclease H-like domain-containing protein [Eubacteriales bacterium]
MITKKLHAGQSIHRNLETYFDPSQILLFDIETTGFSPEHSTLYLIGCGFYKDDTWNIIQWFNDDGASEQEILFNFLNFAKKYSKLLHYNGDGFDLPYIAKKCKHFHISNYLEDINSVDLYKILKPYRNIFHIDNLKLKSLEQFLGITREDKFSGKDLIQIYEKYINHPTKEQASLLLLHNYEDIEGLMDCFCMLGYSYLKDGNIHITDISVQNNKLVFSLVLDYSLPKRITCSKHNIILTANKTDATLQVPIIESTLKFYFENYKDYYYLPAEDMAVHKSVASYVDKHYRLTATKENCYVKHTGCFITQLNQNLIQGYKYEYHNKDSYIELADSFFENEALLTSYVQVIIKELL